MALDALASRDACASASLAPPVAEGCVNTWRDLAERGIFSYDSDPLGGPYRLVGVPAVPLRVGDLGSSIAAVVERVVLVGIELGQDEVVTREQIARWETD